MFLRKDATKHLVIRVDELIRKTTIYAKIAFSKEMAVFRATAIPFYNRTVKLAC